MLCKSVVWTKGKSEGKGTWKLGIEDSLGKDDEKGEPKGTLKDDEKGEPKGTLKGDEKGEPKGTLKGDEKGEPKDV